MSSSLDKSPHKIFEIPDKILNEWRKIGEKGIIEEKKWSKVYNKKNKKIKEELSRIINNKLPKNFDNIIQQQKNKIFDTKPTIATRQSSANVIEEVIKNLPELIGGSADLSGSNNTKTKHSTIIKPANFNGNYIHYGVREHGMAGIMNGMALHGGIIPYGGTFLIFFELTLLHFRQEEIHEKKLCQIYWVNHNR